MLAKWALRRYSFPTGHPCREMLELRGGSYKILLGLVIDQAFAQRAKYKEMGRQAEQLINRCGTNLSDGKAAQHQRSRGLEPASKITSMWATTAVTRRRRSPQRLS